VAELVGSPVPDKGEIYVAGPTAFVSAASDRLALAGVPRDRVHTLVC
jgi:ferredoxin-NADP reductase